MATVVVEKLGPADYARDCAALPRSYGSAGWEALPEVAAIRDAVFSALDRLDAATGFAARLRGRPVLVKPNLVTVYHRMGLVRRSYPESSDPRVLDAAVLWLSRLASELVIVESSGRGAPTRGSFKVAGIDRLARRRGCRLVALDEEPVDRYLLPKASVQREILVPRPFSAVVRGEAAYVSLPKLKTNLYTGVTLGFKNAMGVIPYNLRQRSHHYQIDRKLVEMLYLFKPDLVLIDGVVGGEGECPAPVDPVDSRLVIAGDHAVETDRVATRLMGFDPASIELMRVADELGFGEAGGATVLGPGGGGEPEPLAFRPADASLVSRRVRELCPSVRILLGIPPRPDRLAGPPPPPPAPGEAASPEFLAAMEASCRGGCIATTRFAFSMLEAEGIRARRPAVLILGGGIEAGGRRLWFDAEGGSYDETAIQALPGRKAAIGSCARRTAPLADRFAEGCMPLPNAPHMLLHSLLGAPCRVMSPLRNRVLFPMVGAVLGQRAARRRLISSGERLDVALSLEDASSSRAGPDRRSPGEPEADAGRDWVEWPLPPLGREEARRLLGFEDDAVLAGFRGILVFRLKERALWRLLQAAAGALALVPLALGLAGLLGAGSGRPAGLPGWAWLGILAALLLLRAGQLEAALRARRDAMKRKGRGPDRRGDRSAVAEALILGLASWLPYKLGVFD